MPEIVSNCYETEKNRHLTNMHVHRHNLIFFCIIMLGGKKYGIWWDIGIATLLSTKSEHCLPKLSIGADSLEIIQQVFTH